MALQIIILIKIIEKIKEYNINKINKKDLIYKEVDSTKNKNKKNF